MFDMISVLCTVATHGQGARESRCFAEMHGWWRNIFRGKRKIDKNYLSQHSAKYVMYTLHIIIF